MRAMPLKPMRIGQWSTFSGDVLAGLALAGMLLPEAVAYAAIAGVPTVHALVAALAGLFLYPLLGSSRFATVSSTSSAAAIFASMVAANGTASGYALVGMTGGLFVLAGLLRADFLASFISRPVLRGFTWALAFTIIVRQIPHLLGLPVQGGRVFEVLGQLGMHLTEAHGPSVALGGATLACWLGLHGLRRRWSWLQPSLWVLLLGVAAGVALPLGAQGVALVGMIDLEGVHLAWPDLDWAAWVRTAQLAPALLMILFAESWGAVRSLALQNGDEVHSRREMLALGVSNMASSLVQGLPIGAGFSASAANYAAGGRSKLAGVCAGVAIAVMLLWLRPWLALLPIPVLAAVVIGILLHKLALRPVLTPLRMGGDAWLALVAVAGVLFFGVLFGMLLAVGLSVLLALRRFAQPLCSELGQWPGSHDYVDLASHPDLRRVPHVLILRPEEPVFFANAEAIFGHFRALAHRPGVQAVVLSLEACDDLDTTSVEALSELQNHLHRHGQRLLLARVKDRPRAALQRAFRALAAPGQAVPALTGDSAPPLTPLPWQMYWSVDDAVQEAEAATAPPGHRPVAAPPAEQGAPPAAVARGVAPSQ